MITTESGLKKALDFTREKAAGMKGEMEMPDMAFSPMAYLKPGETQTIRFKVDKTGTFYYGSFSENPQLDASLGMYGKLVVE